MKDKSNGLGSRFFARVKQKNDNIQPYDGEDAIYADGDIADDADIHIDMDKSDMSGGKDYIKSFVDVIRNKVSKSREEAAEDYKSDIVSEDDDELDNQAEAAFDYFRGITKKIDNLKKSVSDAVKLSDSGKGIRNDKEFERYMNDVNGRLEEINTILDERMKQISMSTGDIKNEFSAFDEKTEAISKGILNVTKTTEENVGKISELSDTVKGVKERINEIHTTTNSFDKLYDSVFEFKSAIASMKENVGILTRKQHNMFITMLVLLIVTLLMSIGGVVLGIIALV